MPAHHPLARPVVAAAAALTLAACGSSGGSAPASTPVSSAPAAAGTTVKVVETEFKLALSTTTVTAGTYTFAVHNAGKILHALTVDGPGVQDKSTSGIGPGADGSVTVTLKAGTYDVYCPVGDHKMEGMDAKVTVT